MLKPAGRVFDCADQMSLPPDTFDPLRVDPAVVFGEQARDRPDVVRQAGTRVRSYQQGSLLKSGLLRTGPPPVSIALGPIVLTAMPVYQRLGRVSTSTGDRDLFTVSVSIRMM